ncbi:MAG: restriction endonuclease [Holophagaceae bacterium]|nr:restriction endonuclease [Holophagaceae bacterium]
MAKNETTVWVVRGGRQGEADELFLKGNDIALGWWEMGDAGKLPSTKEAFKKAYVEAYPNAKPGMIPNGVGQIFRFIHEMKIGDLVVYPSKIDRKIHIGTVTGPYKYSKVGLVTAPQRRPVKWLNHLSRTKFSQGALYEIGGALTFFQVKSYADEFRKAAAGSIEEVPVDLDTSTAQVVQFTADSTRDFIVKRLAKDLKGLPFEEFIAHLLGAMGYRTKLQPEGKQGGVDILAYKDELGLQPPIVKVQVKCKEDSDVGDPEVAALFGRLAVGEFGLVINLGGFTNKAVQYARTKANLKLISGEDLVDLILEHYEKFDSRYKGLLPLKRVYVPEVIETPEI